ncbi:hypothetical protein [Novosphingobium kaempferiae]|nr:hypothetical protein [Novosphingobium kaempferiae]
MALHPLRKARFSGISAYAIRAQLHAKADQEGISKVAAIVAAIVH